MWYETTLSKYRIDWLNTLKQIFIPLAKFYCNCKWWWSMHGSSLFVAENFLGELFMVLGLFFSVLFINCVIVHCYYWAIMLLYYRTYFFCSYHWDGDDYCWREWWTIPCTSYNCWWTGICSISCWHCFSFVNMCL